MAEQDSFDEAVEDEGATDTVDAADHLDEQLGGEETGAQAGDSGIEEALRAWAAGGRAVEEEAVADEIVPVQFAQLELPAPQKIKPRFGRINNVFVDITVELGRKEMSVRDLTNLKEQEVIDLDKLAGEAFDILINGRPFAEGEIVVVTDLMAVRITRLIDRTPPEEEEEA